MKSTFKNFLLLSILTIVSNAAFSQIQWGVRAGTNFSNMTRKSFGHTTDSKINNGFHAGVTADIPLQNDFYIQTGLLYSQKGYKIDTEIPQLGTIKYTSNMNYLEVPINFVYKPGFGNGNLLLGAGPYVGYGILGKIKYPDLVRDIEWGKNKHYKPFDAGAGLLAGYEFNNKVSIQLNAQLGLINIAPETLSGADTKFKNSSFGISLGYKF